ncbi:MAG: hypothetical protein ABR498_09465 [Candidatus Dormibacteria bacterium]
MPTMSKQTAKYNDEGPGVEWVQDLADQRVSIVEVKEDADLTPLLQGLPNDQCQCPHSGYVFKGEIWWRYGDRLEVVKAGEAYHAPPGHTSGAKAGSEFLVISPANQMDKLEAHMAKRAQELGATP